MQKSICYKVGKMWAMAHSSISTFLISGYLDLSKWIILFTFQLPPLDMGEIMAWNLEGHREGSAKTAVVNSMRPMTGLKDAQLAG